ncbi:MAG: hypothetical protein LWW82_12970, partial [Comamonadaceae bacterium]|nr:hypothetical protein [Comamonadaceae bacterium]
MKYGCIPSLALALCASHLFVGCTHAAASTTNQPQNHSPSTVAFDPTDRSQYRYIYAVYCNGTVDKLDLVRRTKVSSFQISEHSGTPPAVAVLPSAGMRPGTCLARAVVTADTHDQAAGVVNIVASDQLQPDEDGQAHFRLLTFALPAWTLQHTRDLGRFNVLNGTPPRMTRIADGSLAVRQVSSANPATEIANQVKTYIGTETLGWLTATEWSASNVLLDYALPDQTGTGIALANQAHRRVIRMAEFHK